MDLSGLPTGLPRPAVVKNTFPEFADQDDGGDDPWLLSGDTRRQQTDSVVERLRLRSSLEQSIVDTLRSHLGQQGTSSSAGLLTSSSGAHLSQRPLPTKWQAPQTVELPAPLSRDKVIMNMAASWDSRQRSSETEPGPEPNFMGGEALADQSSEDDEADDDVPLPSVLLAQLATGVANRPAGKSDLALGEVPESLKSCTTVMMRHIPCKYTQRKLLREVNGVGFLGRYDFMYLPMDPRRRANRGFAFFNLESENAVAEFYHTFHGKRLLHYTAENDLEVVPAEIQGFDANAEHYLSVKATRRARDMHSQPLFLRNTGGKGGKGANLPNDAIAAEAVGAARGGTRGGAAPRREAMMPQGPRGNDSFSPASRPAPAAQMWQMPQQSQPTLLPRFCPHCGQPKSPEHSFCPYCGCRLGQLPPMMAQQPPQQQPPLQQPQQQQQQQPPQQRPQRHQQPAHQQPHMANHASYNSGAPYEGFATFSSGEWRL